MKKLLLATTIMLLILAMSGCCCCSNIPSTSPGQPTAIPTQSSPSAPVTGNSFAGTWDTDYGKMVLTATGNKVTGTYTLQEGTINGTVTGNKLTGTWTQGPSHKPPDDAGDFVFTLSADGSSFDGLWRYGHSDDPGKKFDGYWYGTRTA